MKAIRIALLTALASARAHAYPQYQFSSGETRCIACHLSPTGGGLLSDYGRDAAGGELASFGGDGNFLHGVGRSTPDWLVLGGDLRGAFLVNDVQDPDGTKIAVFPMQADVAASLALPRGFSLTGNVGIRGQVRDPDLMVPSQNYQPISYSRVISREHYATWQSPSLDLYVKVGRFYAPFGLRLPDHVFYVRRDLGFNLMEESYNVSAGYLGDESELHVTAFAPDELRRMGGTEWGAAVVYEHLIAEQTGALGAQAKVARGVGMTRWIAGGTAKQYVPVVKTLFFAETDVIYNAYAEPMVGATVQLVGLAGVSVFPVRGLIVSLYGEHAQTDVRVGTSRSEATSLQTTWMPYAHVELQAFGRLQMVSHGDVAKTLLLQLHYHL